MPDVYSLRKPEIASDKRSFIQEHFWRSILKVSKACQNNIIIFNTMYSNNAVTELDISPDYQAKFQYNATREPDRGTV